MDSQSLKSTGVVGGEARGYDGGKKVKGRKRHILVDTQGLVLKAKIHSAKVMDYEGIKTLLKHAHTAFPRLRHLSVAGWRLPGGGQGWRLGREDLGVECRARRAPTKACSQRGVDGVGEGVGQRRRQGRLG